MANDPYAQFNQGSEFHQQGQTVHGAQYNAENLHVQHTHPQAVADGIAAERQRRRAHNDALRRRDRERYDATQRKVMRLTWWLVGIMAASVILVPIIGELLFG